MRLLNNLKIGVKLPVIMVLIGAISLMLAEVIATGHTRDSVLGTGASRLSAVAQSRAGEVRSVVAAIRADVKANLSNPVVLEAARALVHAHDRYGPQVDADLRRLYVDENPNHPDALSRLVDPGDRSSYSLVHRRYHGFFRSRIRGRGFSDLYLVAPDGRVVYSVRKGALFARNIETDPSLDPVFRDVFRTARDGTGETVDAVSNLSPGPAGVPGLSALFAVPILSPLGTVEAVLVKRVPIRRFDTIMERPTGLGQTGHVFLAGTDGQVLTTLKPAPAGLHLLDVGERGPVQAALSGQSGVLRQSDSSGRPLMVAFAPASMPGMQLAVVARQSEDEILSAARSIRESMITDGLVALSFVSVLGLALARSMSVPLTRVEHAMARVSDGEYGDDIPDRVRNDEIGDIARRLDAFRTSLLTADSTLRENAFKGAAFESTASALMLVDSDLTIIYVNGAMVDLFRLHRVAFDRQVPGFRPDALPGRSLTTFYPGALAGRARLADTVSDISDLRFGQRHFQVAMSPVRDLDGAGMGYVVEWADVTDQRMNDVLLDVINGRFLIAGFSADGRIISANRTFQEWSGSDSVALTGRSWDWLFCRDGRAPEEGGTLRWAALVSLEPGAPVQIRQPGAARGWMLASVSPVRDASGHLQRYVMVGSASGQVQQGQSASAGPGMGCAEATL